MRKKKAQEREQFCQEIAGGLHQEESMDHQQEESMDYQKEIYSRLDKIVQSSALVECINSIIRPNFNTTKNHVTQGLLNLIMYYPSFIIAKPDFRIKYSYCNQWVIVFGWWVSNKPIQMG